ncbi:unnamed protein product, partial [Phaeothamnion confervicola]
SPPARRVRCRKRLFVSRPPRVLCLHFCRRHYCARRGGMVRLRQRVVFPETLDLEPYHVDGDDDGGAAGGGPILYRLQAVIEHHGSAEGGHY